MKLPAINRVAGRRRTLIVTAIGLAVVCAGAAISWATVEGEPTRATSTEVVAVDPGRTAVPASTASPSPVPIAVPTPITTTIPKVVATPIPKPTATPATSSTADHPSANIVWTPVAASATLHPDDPAPTQLFAASFPEIQADPELSLEGEQPTSAGTDIVGKLWEWQARLNDLGGPEGPNAYYDISIYDPPGSPSAAIQSAIARHGIGTKSSFQDFPYVWELDGSKAPVAAARQLYIINGTHVVVITAQGSAAGVTRFYRSIHLKTLNS